MEEVPPLFFRGFESCDASLGEEGNRVDSGEPVMFHFFRFPDQPELVEYAVEHEYSFGRPWS